MVHMSVEGDLVRAKALTIPGNSESILEKSIVRAKKALALEGKSGLNFSGACAVPHK